MSNTVIVRFDEHGEMTYLVNGEHVRLYIVDERAPGDRVYEWLPRNSDDEIAAVVPVGETIGNSKDERHEVLAHRIRSAQAGVRHLSAVEEPPHA